MLISTFLKSCTKIFILNGAIIKFNYCTLIYQSKFEKVTYTKLKDYYKELFICINNV